MIKKTDIQNCKGVDGIINHLADKIDEIIDTLNKNEKGTSVTVTKDSIVIKFENEELEKPNFELGSIEGASIKIEETDKMYVKGGMKINDLISRVINAESAITQIILRIGADNK